MGQENRTQQAQIELEHVRGQEGLEDIRRLFLEYAHSLNVDLGFQNFNEELEALPGKYGPPHGALILARVEGKAAGCIALRRIDDDVCEMKRLYVRDAYRGKGLGKRLIGSLIEEAKGLGYRLMRLDTLAAMERALGLYRDFGFCEIEPYIYNPLEGAMFMELDLALGREFGKI